MLLYIDSSVALRAAIPSTQRDAWRRWVDDALTRYDAVVSSRLLRTEVVRVLRREGLPLTAGDAVLSRVRLLAVTDATFVVAESIERHIKTLNALHVASALLIGLPLIIATHDSLMVDVAATAGLRAVDPVGPGNLPNQ